MNSDEIVDMLKARGKDQEALFALTRRARAQRFGDSAFLRGVVDHGQETGFHAGANVVTCNLTPERFRVRYSLYSQKRPNKSLQDLVAMIHRAGLKIANDGYAAKSGRPPHPARRLAPNGLDAARVPGNIAKTRRPS